MGRHNYTHQFGQGAAQQRSHPEEREKTRQLFNPQGTTLENKQLIHVAADLIPPSARRTPPGQDSPAKRS
jgi:hypothetical protein